MYLDEEALRARMPELFRFATVGRCANGVTHDVNNLLGVIMAYAELVGLDESIGEDSRSMLTRVVESAEKCNKLISSLTTVARKSADNPVLLDVCTIVADTLALREYDFKTAQISLQADLPHPGPSLFLNAPQVELALLHLLFNAQEAVEPVSEKIVRVAVRPIPGGVELAVWNSGPAWDLGADIQPQPFTTQKDGVHLGLGLFQAHATAQAHGGTLRYTPNEGVVISLHSLKR